MPRWLWTGGAVEYRLAIPPIEAAERLRAAVKPESVLRRSRSLPTGPVGRVEGLNFRLTTRNPLIRNFVDSILKGQIVESPGGCRLLGTFRMEEFAAIFMPVWLVLAMLIAITASVSALIAPER